MNNRTRAQIMMDMDIELQVSACQREWDRTTEAAYIAARNQKQNECTHNKLFRSGLCALCGKWTAK